jgi:branched-chain amino acid transport system permease protein
MTGNRSSRTLLVAIVILGLCLALVPFTQTPFHTRVVMHVLCFGGMAVAWNIFGGLTGYWSFGHTAFVGIGAFVSGLVENNLDASMHAGLKIAIGTAAALTVSTMLAVIAATPILRLRGIYFAIGMLCIAEIVSEVVRNFDIFSGSLGLSYPTLLIGSLNKLQSAYMVFLALFVASLLVFALIKTSRFGLGLMCIGQDEDTAGMMGIPVERFKFLAFVISAGLTTLFGVIYAHSLGFVTAGSVFRTEISLNLIVSCMLGGVGSVFGPVLGATLMIFITEVLLGSVLNLHLLFTGLVLIAVVLAAPDGILGVAGRLLARIRAHSRGQAKVIEP